MERKLLKKKSLAIFLSIFLYLSLGNLAKFNNFYSEPEEILDVKASTNDIQIHTPENRTYYDSMSGYYLGTHGFEEVKNGDIPVGWVFFSNDPSGNGESFVVDKISGHYKVLKLKHGGTLYQHTNIVSPPFNPTPTTGFVEWWAYYEDNGQNHGGAVFIDGYGATWGSSAIVGLKGDGSVLYYDGSTINYILGYELDTWHHFKIEFDCSTDKYNLTVNNIQVRTNVNFFNPLDYVNAFRIQSSNENTCNMYYDGIGYSWDTDYNKADNLQEGLLLNFKRTFTPDWQGYCLDGLVNKTIQGNTTFPLPQVGTHTIRVFGNNSVGTMFHSELRYFTINKTRLEFLPNINWTFIHKVEIISGNNEKVNDITDLQFKDDNTYDITGNWTGTQWEYEVYFSYEVDLHTYQLDYYDIYLFLDIDTIGIPIKSDLIEFHTYSSYKYKHLINITDQPINMEGCFLERTTKFRLIGETSTEKIIKIDRIALVLTHEGRIDYTTRVNVSSLENLTIGTFPSGWKSGEVNDFNPNWFADDGDFQYAWFGCQLELLPDTWGDSSYGYAYVIAVIRMYMDFDFSGGVITSINSGEFNIKHSLTFWRSGPAGIHRGINTLAIWNSSNWDTRISRNINLPIPSGQAYTYTNTDVLCSSAYFRTYWDKLLILNGYDSYLKFRDFAWCNGTGGGGAGGLPPFVPGYIWVDTRLEYASCFFSFNGYNFSNPKNDYLRFLDIRTEPLPPIIPPLTETFDLVATVSKGFNNIGVQNVEFLIANDSWNSGWASLSHTDENEWKSTLNTADFELGKYNVWLKGTDHNGYTSLEQFEIELKNGQPQIEFLTPSEDFEVVTQLYDYTICTNIIDPEGELFWEFEIPQIRIYKDELNPLIDWTNMTYDFLESHYIYNFTIDPVNFSNGIYTIEVRARDFYDYNYRKISIKIQKPSEDDPLVIIVITTMSIAGVIGVAVIIFLLRKRSRARRS